MDSGAPQASNRAGSRAGGGGVKPPAGKTASKTNGAAAKTNGNGARRPGPVDPRTEDLSSPPGLSRSGKTIWRRPGALTPRTAKHREVGSIDAPIEFSVALPLAPADTKHVPTEQPPTEQMPSEPPPTELAPTELAPTELAPTEMAPTERVEAKDADTIVEPKVEELIPAPLAPTELVPTTPIAPTLPPAELRTIPVPLPNPSPILYDEAATIDDVTKIGPILDTRPLHRPITFRRAPKPRVRRVTRVVRHVDTWSVFKVALVFNVFFYAVAMVAGVLLWQVAYATGTIDNVEKFFEGFGWESFDFKGGQIFHNAWIAGVFVAVGLTGLAVLLATLFNLITDLVGGVRFSVLEEEVRTRAERGTEPVVYEAVMVPPVEPELEIAEEPALEAAPADSADQGVDLGADQAIAG